MRAQVLRQLFDPLREQRDLHLRGAGVATGSPVAVENLALCVLREGHDRRRLAKVQVPPGVAAGHPATAQAGLEILEDGGTAADAAVAAALASCVAESVMTGIAGGGYAIWLEAGRGRAEVLDFFVDVPGLGNGRETPALEELAVPFGEELVHYFVGAATCAVPASRRDSTSSGGGPGRSLGAAGRARAPPRRERRLDAARAREVPRDARARDDDARGRAHLLARRTSSSRQATGSTSRASSPRSRSSAQKVRAAFYEGTLGEALLELMEPATGS